MSSSSGWEVRFSNSRQIPYFYHAESSTSTWDPPADLTNDQIRQLPGASKYLPGAAAGASGPGGAGGKEGQVRGSHILAKHAGSRRPSSWRKDNITITKDEATRIIQDHINTLKAASPADLPKEFARIASTESDCSSARKGGDLGWFGRGQMQKPFEVSESNLQPDYLTPLVQ
ncbi:peptidyl-prolyl cis-trans isomerase NIMA-interacting 1 [Kwoniella heveanensis CBS 569]|uniref:Peptidyl-prolyl cis-trans isomerase n=1 Tax=Kwoniella heveanensis BCC8398 TaxID=1296120 RepID=A0A1B9GQI1_9TREE|nr:peptidyl-prolyl cis-trans isomerase NIMA-interacting 1 [Kwoniella heveanensis BCC8398]OCF39528.1 peptidyl-prolyl cis-trans isomerase NIMA-interacting 1 [Kwoniella heveanensis CBS 569]